jgi:hypothetical protein
LGFVTERSITGSFADTTMKTAIDAIRTISSTVHSLMPLDIRRLQSRTMKANEYLAQYHQDYMSATLTSKRGWFRKNVFGSPLYFTFRAVISSLSERHEYDELHLPWGVAVSTYEIHLSSKLMRRESDETGRPFTPNQIKQHIREHTLRYSPLLDSLFHELIEECPHKGLPVLFNRNPSLDRGSIQEFFVTKINPDPKINAVAMSVLTLKAPNADFDGDELNGTLLLSNRLERAFRVMAPHMGVLDLDRPRMMSRNQAMPPPVASTIGQWVHRGK